MKGHNYKTRQITSNEVDNVELRRLYQTAFPGDEQIPWVDLMRLVEEILPANFVNTGLGINNK